MSLNRLLGPGVPKNIHIAIDLYVHAIETRHLYSPRASLQTETGSGAVFENKK